MGWPEKGRIGEQGAGIWGAVHPGPGVENGTLPVSDAAGLFP